MTGDDMVNGLHEMLETLAPMREAVKGFRAQLVEDGWTAEAAERIAEALLTDLLHKPFAR